MTKVHLIGNAHIDPVWLWQWQEGYAEIKATFRSALDRLTEFPDFVFTCACAAYYKWIEENNPEMFEEIKQRVAEGRWVIVGGWWIQPDCNLPTGESFARHSLYGQRYFLEKFGVMAKTGYNVDSFGHNGMLPQLLKLSGMDYYVFMRPQEHEKHLNQNLFWWESEDGSRVMTFRLAEYTIRNPLALEEHILTQQALGRKENVPHMAFYGIGNHGGGPTIANLRTIDNMIARDAANEILLSSPNTYFADAEQIAEQLPVYKDEMQHHAIGCYSTHSESKKYNRKVEHRLLSAEKLSSIANVLLELPYPSEQLNLAWENVMFNHFHDIMGGCSIKEAFDDVRDVYGEAMNLSAKAMNAAMQKMTWAIHTMKPEITSLSKDKDGQIWEIGNLGVPFVVFNPLSWEVSTVIQANKKLANVTDDTGTTLPIQTVRASRTDVTDKWDTLFACTLPAMGYKVFWMYRDKAPDTTPILPLLKAEAHALENDWVRIEFDAYTGYIKRYFDKRNQVEIFSGKAAVPIVIDEHHSDTWGHGLERYRDEIGRFTGATISVIEEGPLRATIRVTSTYANSTLRQDFMLTAHSPEVKVNVRLDWREGHQMLKLSFPVAVEAPKATWEIPYGFIERPTDGKEVPGLQWTDISGIATTADEQQNSMEYGFGLLNDAKYAYDALGNEIRLTVVRSPLFADHYASRDELMEFMDQGIQEFSYRMVPHTGNWQAGNLVRKAYELNTPPIQLWETYHEGPLPQTFSGITVSSEHVIATTLKRAEDGAGWILRCYETAGQAAQTTISLSFLSRTWSASFGKCEIKTFYIPFEPTEDVREVNFLEL